VSKIAPPSEYLITLSGDSYGV